MVEEPALRTADIILYKRHLCTHFLFPVKIVVCEPFRRFVYIFYILVIVVLSQDGETTAKEEEDSGGNQQGKS